MCAGSRRKVVLINCLVWANLRRSLVRAFTLNKYLQIFGFKISFSIYTVFSQISTWGSYLLTDLRGGGRLFEGEAVIWGGVAAVSKFRFFNAQRSLKKMFRKCLKKANYRLSQNQHKMKKQMIIIRASDFLHFFILCSF